MRPPWKRRTPDDLAASGDVDGLLAALTPRTRDFIEESTGYYDVGWQRRAGAAEHLAPHPGERVTSALSTALADATEAVRLQALLSLAGRADAADDLLVEQVLIWPEAGARESAEVALRARAERDPSAAARLLAAYARVDDVGDAHLSDGWVRDVAALADRAARASLVERAVRDVLAGEGHAHRVGQVLAAAGEDAVPALTPELADGENRLAAIRLLGRLHHDGATPALIEMIDQPAAEVRRAAAVALGEIKDPHAIDALLRHTADEDYDVRDAALRALDGFGTAAVVWGLASVARGVLTSVTGDDWIEELESADPREIPELPVVRTHHVDAEADEVTAEAAHEDPPPLVEGPAPPADERIRPPLDASPELDEATAVRRRRGFWR